MSLEQGRKLRDEGMALAVAHAPFDWTYKFIAECIRLENSMQPFNADDVIEIIGDPPNPHAVGGLITGRIKGGWLIRVGYRQMRRSKAHARNTSVYVGKR